MEVKIGVQNASRELTIDVDVDTEQLTKNINDALSHGEVLTLTDAKGRTVLVPATALAYVEIGSGATGPVGFRS